MELVFLLLDSRVGIDRRCIDVDIRILCRPGMALKSRLLLLLFLGLGRENLTVKRNWVRSFSFWLLIAGRSYRMHLLRIIWVVY